MATLDDLRAKLPSLRGLSDEQALQYLQQRYTPDVPVATIARNLGVKLPDPPAPPTPKRSLFAVANDTVIEAANAAAGTVGSMANFVSPGNRFSQGVDEFIRKGEASQSDAVKADKARLRERMEGAQGIGDEVAAVGGYIADAPLQALAQAAGSIAVPAGAMRGAAALGGGVKTGLGVGAAIGGAGAGGDAAGTAYELAKEAGATEEEATAAARSASVLPGIVGAAGGVVGAERLLAGAKGFGGNAVSRALKTAGVEGVQEGIEEGITQYEGQRAAMPFDPTIDPMKGVAGAATMGAALGGITGGGVALLSGEPAGPSDEQIKREAADLALDDIGKAASVDEAVAAFTAATDIPVLPGQPQNQPAREARARNAETLAWLRDLEPQERTNALGLIATLQRPNLPETVRRSVSAQLNALERKARTVPTGEASEMLPTPDVTEAADIPAGEATEVQPNLVLDNQLLINKDRTFREKSDALRQRLTGRPGVEATELVPTGDATEVEDVPTPDVFEDIPTPEAAELLPVGDAAEVIPAGEVIEPAEPLPTGEATDIVPEQADTALLLTNDGMPYGTLSGAKVRAKREGLPPDAVVEVQGGWAVKKEPEGGPAQPDVPGTTAVAGRAGAPRGADAGGGGALVGRVAADTRGTDTGTPASAAPGGAAAAPVGNGLPADPALRIKALSAQWADAVARGDMAEAKRLNDAIVEAKKPAAPTPAPASQAAAPTPAPETREQAIRRTWASAPRPVNQWTPMTVSVGEGDARRSNDMLVIQRKARGDGQADAVLTMRVLRMGRLLASDPPEPLLFTFKLTGENKVEQVGRARVPTAEDIAQWEGAGLTVPGKKAEAPKPVEPERDTLQDTPVSRAEPASDREPERVKVMTRFGQNVYVNKADLDSDKDRFRHFTSTGKSLGIIVRDNLDPTGEKRAESNREDADNPLFDVIGTRDGRAFASEAAALRERSMRGLDDTYDIVPMSGGFALKRKAPAQEPPAAPAPEPAPQVSTRTPEPPPPAPTNPPAPAAQTRPEELIELRKRASVLKQLLECLG